ncbi:MAG: 5-(carboxyamino)imidazole ribonucleotide mutase [Kiritimatiellia bacterium]
MRKRPEIGIVLGSDSDWPFVSKAIEVLEDFKVGYEVRVISAHRTPDLAATYARSAARRGIRVIIAAAGGAAHLPGVIAAYTTLPVIGLPIKSGALNGLDSLLSMAQMPTGIPVATVTLGDAGPLNAAILAVQILSCARTDLAERLHIFKSKLQSKVKMGNSKVQTELAKRERENRN